MFKNFFPKSKDRKSRFILYFLLFLFFAGIGIFAFAHQSAATGLLFGLFEGAGSAVATLVGTLVSLIVSFLGYLLIIIIQILINVSQYNKFIDSIAVTTGWVIIRDVANMGFIVVLLVIAFSTVLGIEQYSWKKMLGRVLIMAVLINFSKMICGLFIDFSQVIMLTFVNGFKETAGGNFAEFLGIRKWTEFDWARAEVGTGISGWYAAVSYLLALLISVIAVVVIGIMLVVLVARIVALWILVVLSPIAYIAHVIPGGEKYASQWWQSFAKYLIVGPALAFFIWLSLSMPSRLEKEGGIRKEMDLPEAKSGKEGARIEELRIGETQIGTTENMLGYIIAIGMLIAGLMVTQNLGVVGSNMAGNVVKGQGMAVGALKKLTGVRWAQERWSAYQGKREAIRKEKAGRFGEMLSATQDRLATLPGLRRLRRPRTVREAEMRIRDYEKSLIDRKEKEYNVAGMNETALWAHAQSRDRILRIAATRHLESRGMLNIDAEGELRGDPNVKNNNQRVVDTVNRMRQDLADIPEMRTDFDKNIKKSSPELAARSSIYNKFQNAADYQRFLRDGDLKEIDTFAALEKMTIDTVRDLNNRIETATGNKECLISQLTKRAEDPKTFTKQCQDLSSAKRNQLFNSLQFGQLTDANDREKAFLASGRPEQIYKLSDPQQKKEYEDVIRNNKSAVEKTIDLKILGAAGGTEDYLEIILEKLEKIGIERIVKDRGVAAEDAILDGLEKLVNRCNNNADYSSPQAILARSLFFCLSKESDRALKSYDPQNKTALDAFKDAIKDKKIKTEDIAKISGAKFDSEHIECILKLSEVSDIQTILEKGDDDLKNLIRLVLSTSLDSQIQNLFAKLQLCEWYK